MKKDLWFIDHITDWFIVWKKKFFIYILDIPIRLILTKADKFSACGYSGLSNIFWSTDAENKVKQAEKVFDLQESQVHPIANYVSGTKQNITQDVLALLAMNNIFQEALLYIKFDYTFKCMFQKR